MKLQTALRAIASTAIGLAILGIPFVAKSQEVPAFKPFPITEHVEDDFTYLANECSYEMWLLSDTFEQSQYWWVASAGVIGGTPNMTLATEGTLPGGNQVGVVCDITGGDNGGIQLIITASN
jgi:hypothetical protein